MSTVELTFDPFRGRSRGRREVGVWTLPGMPSPVGQVYIDAALEGLDGLVPVFRVTHEIGRSPSRVRYGAAHVGWRPVRFRWRTGPRPARRREPLPRWRRVWMAQALDGRSGLA